MLVLASASPRRLDLLRDAGFDPTVDPAHTEEIARDGETPAASAARFAREKAMTVARRHPDDVVLGADTVVIVDGQLLGKPRDADDAARMLRLLSGHGHWVVTCVAIVPPRLRERPPINLEVTTAVFFRHLTDGDVTRYLATDEWRDKAGAYAIQGRAAAFVRGIEGSYTNVVGLPLAEVVDELRAMEVSEP